MKIQSLLLCILDCAPSHALLVPSQLQSNIAYKYLHKYLRPRGVGEGVIRGDNHLAENTHFDRELKMILKVTPKITLKIIRKSRKFTPMKILATPLLRHNGRFKNFVYSKMRTYPPPPPPSSFGHQNLIFRFLSLEQ